MSTVERREEIGVLRAVGFQRRDVLRVMLAEALLLGIFGGLVGIVLSLGAGLLINHLVLDDALAVVQPESIGYILLAFAFGVLASVVSGLYPAWKAASEEPVEALRS
nr:FtsX-like permease family protein [Haloarcula sp. CK38]